MPQAAQSATTHQGVRINYTDDHAFESSGNQRLGTRRGTAMMRTRLEVYVQGCPARCAVHPLQGLDLRVGQASPAMKAFTDHPTAAYDHRAHGRVGARTA